MVYQGGKFYQSKHIAEIVNKCIKDNDIENYYELFVGGASILDKIICKNYYANDIDNELIAFYEYIKNGGFPLEDVSKEEYYIAKNSREKFEPYYLGNIKYMASFVGKPWGGYSGMKKTLNHSRYRGSLKVFTKQIPKLKKTNFSCIDYE